MEWFDKPLPRGGPYAKYIDSDVPILTVISGIQETLQDLGLAIARIPDTDFPEGIKQIAPSDLGKEIEQMSASPVVQRIKNQSNEVARQLGLLIHASEL